jgi:hypothetical protein
MSSERPTPVVPVVVPFSGEKNIAREPGPIVIVDIPMKNGGFSS